MVRWGDLFNARQKLALITFADAVRRAYKALTPSPSPTAAGEGSKTPPSPQAWGEGGQGDEGYPKTPQRPSPDLIQRARQLRQQQTPAEQLLWELLRNRQLLGRKFRRQHPIGQFITDFFCDDARLIIEVDGAVHQEPTQQERDRAREEVLRQFDYYLLRFTNEQVLNETEQVLQRIAEFVQMHSYESPHPQPLSQAAGEGRKTPPSPQAWGEGGRGDEGTDPEFAKAVTTYLALTLDKLVMFTSSNCTWKVDTTQVINAFVGRQAIQMTWDYFEMNPISGVSASWPNLVEVCIDSFSIIPSMTFSHPSPEASGEGLGVRAHHGSATQLPWPDDYFDAVLTDPPYYINVPYADLSDFFYVWLKRTLGDLYPDLFATPLTPKSEEICQMEHWDPDRYAEKTKEWFEAMLTMAFSEIRRVLKPEGVAVIVFAYPKTEAWEAVINAILNAGLYMTASWPIHTEMQARLRAQESAALASSIYMVCRKRPADAPIGEFPAVRREIEERVRRKLAQFWEEGIRGADFFMSAIGPAVEAFGKHARVEKLSGEPVEVTELLEYVRKVVSEFALERVLKNAQLGGIDAPTRFYLLYRWTYNHARVPFDEARKLASGVGVELTEHWQEGGLVRKEKEYVRVVTPQERAKDGRFEKQTQFATMVDALHRACILWERNRQKELAEHLQTYGGNEFWQVAQAVSEVLPEGDKEKQTLQGLLYGRKQYTLERQRRLFEEERR